MRLQNPHRRIQKRSFFIDRTKTKYENTYLVAMHAICKGCGLDFNEAGMTDEKLTAHDLQHILNGEDSSYYEPPFTRP